VAALTLALGVVGSGVSGLAGAAPAGAGLGAGPSYQLSLGDSLAAGTGASTSANNYVNRVAAHEAAAFPGLTAVDDGCGGATTTSMINGPGCSYPDGTQLAQAEDFLRTHRGQVAYVTLDIGANDVDGCITGGTINVNCVLAGLQTVKQNLPVIISGLEEAAGPGVPLFGMDYYDPFLAAWVQGSQGQTTARQSATFSAVFNGDLTDLYAEHGAVPVDVQGPFAVQDFAMTSRYNGQAVPEGVGRTCAWTHMCQSGDIHANDIGHAVVAEAFEGAIDRWHQGSGRGTWYDLADGTVSTTGDAPTLAGTAVPGSRSLQPTADRRGYWLAGSGGAIGCRGDAPCFGSYAGRAAPMVSLAVTPNGWGGWLLDQSGAVFALGDAPYLGGIGTPGATAPPDPAVAIVSTGSGNGYWIVTASGKVSGFGDAANLGDLSGTHLNAPVVGAVASPDGNGYLLAAADGGVFAFGDALFRGSRAGSPLNAPVVGVALAPDGNGYELGAADGGIFAFGSQPFTGSLAGHPLPAAVTAIAET
jgi:lysophospholipase L1-like esterase